MSVALLQTAIDGFTAVLNQVPDDRWNVPTKCDGWDVNGLMAHIVGGTLMSNAVVRGASRDEAVAMFAGESADASPADVRAKYAAGVADQVKAFSEAGALERICHHPAGDMPGDRLLMFRIGDYALHTWDLGASQGIDVKLDNAVLEYVWAALSPMAPMLGQIGVFGQGPSGNVPETADLQTRVLDLSGRRP